MNGYRILSYLCIIDFRPSPEGETRVNSSNADTVTARNVRVDTAGSQPRHRNVPSRETTDAPDGGYIGLYKGSVIADQALYYSLYRVYVRAQKFCC